MDQIKEQDLLLLQAVARVSLIAARGPLAQQIGVPQETIDEPVAWTKRVDEEPSRPLPFMELPYFNSLGGFRRWQGICHLPRTGYQYARSLDQRDRQSSLRDYSQ